MFRLVSSPENEMQTLKLYQFCNKINYIFVKCSNTCMFGCCHVNDIEVMVSIVCFVVVFKELIMFDMTSQVDFSSFSCKDYIFGWISFEKY